MAKRVNPYRTANKFPWYRAYRARMHGGEERCRHCGSEAALTFGHITSVADGGRPTFANTTILCLGCNQKQGSESWPWQISLAEEEAAAPPERRWSQVHPEAVRAVQRRRAELERKGYIPR